MSKKSKKPVKKSKTPVKKVVKKKTAPKKKRKVNRWIQLKSLIWSRVKDEDIYDYRS